MSHTYHESRSSLGALHGILLSFPVALFSTGLASDIAYLNTAEIQWTNFASWAIAGALVFNGLVLALALIDWVSKLRHLGSRRRLVYVAILAVTFVVGLVNAFHHARDAWSSVGTTGLILSVLTTLLALAAGWMFFSRTVRWDVAR
jgi:uncharacterized membrane protein